MTDREVLKPLVEKVLALSDREIEQSKKELWARLNALQSVEKVPVCVTFEGIPARQWDLVFGPDHLRCTGPLGRQIEFDLKKRIWMAENVPEDHVVWAAILVPAVQASPPDWGVPVEWRGSGDELGAKEIVAPFAERIEVARLRRPATEVDDRATQSRLDEASDLVQGRLAVHPRYPRLDDSPFDMAVRLRGMENLFLDVYDRPDEVHAMMRFITDSIIADHHRRERHGWINCPPDPSGRYQMVPIYRHIAAYLAEDFSSRPPRLADEWAYISAQTSAGLGPEMYEEFVNRYNCQIGALYTAKTVYYHGCECLDAKLDSIARIPNLRRHHVSPWSSLERAVQKYRGSVVLEVHVHPTEVFFGATREKMARDIEVLLKAAAGHPMCLNLSDIHSLGGNPETLRIWAEVAQEMVDKCR